MGCSGSKAARKRTNSKVTIDSLETELSDHKEMKKRYGHPSYYKTDGFEVGLRIKVKGQHQSFFVGTSRADGAKVTMKEFYTINCKETDITEEIITLAKLSHDSIPKLKEIFITNISVFAVFDFIDSMRLKHYVDLKKQTSSLSAQDVRKIVQAVVSATSHCHSQDVILRNITSENIAVRRDGREGLEVKLADFSLAVHTGAVEILCDHPLFDWNDVAFMAPEALLGHPYSTAMDVWSIGVALFLMVAGQMPFSSPDDRELIESIKNASFQFDNSNPAWVAADTRIKRLVEDLLVATPGERISARDVMKNQWLVTG